jgi:hypothetical protein
MDDLNDIAVELSDTDEHSVDNLEDCPSPPPPFHRSPNEQTIIVAPPIKFNDQEQTVNITHIVPFDNIFFNDAKSYLFGTTIDTISPTNDAIRKQNTNFFQRFINFFRSAMNSNDDLEYNRQCEQLLNLTKYPCNMTDRMHIRILYTIYRRLTNSKEIFYSAYGVHWEEIGFQTANPETDFRSTGLFSIFFLLYFVDSMYLPLAKQIYLFSHDKEQQFPFCCIGINLANIIIKFIRQPTSRMNIRKVMNEKNSENSAVDLFGKLFIALYLNFYLQWKENCYTIENTQQVLGKLEQTLSNRPRSLFEEFENYFRRKQSENRNQHSQQYEFKQTNDNLV